jgi:integrase
MNLSYDFRAGKTRIRPRAKQRPHNVRWTVKGKRHDEYFATAALADSFRAELTQAAARGEAFDIDTGLPVSILRKLEQKANAVTWMSHAKEYASYKWPRLAGKARVSVAEVLVTLTLALLPESGKSGPDEGTLRTALFRWAFNAQERDEPMPVEIRAALEWADANSPAVSVLADLDILRHVMDCCARRLDGKPAAATYLARRRQVLHNVLKYAVTKKRLATIPLNDPELNWELPSDMEVDHEVDPRSVGHPRQVEQVLAAVSYVGRRQGLRFLAFFACLYYGMLRPEEVVGLRVQDCHLPETGWGRLTLEKTKPAPGKAWTDDGEVHDDRGLKHRSRKTVRPVPIPPELVRLIRWHLEHFGSRKDGRIFRSVNDKPVSPGTYNKVWSSARQIGLSPDQRASVLLKRPYDLRHAGITVRLYAGVPPKQVAQWAGHSVEVLQRVYSKILDGFDDTWFEKIDKVFGRD